MAKVRTGQEIMEKAAASDTDPAEGCRRHRHHVSGCKGCIESYVDRVAWRLAHPDRQAEPDLPKLDPTPCGVCGSVIGEGLMLMHMQVCPGRTTAHIGPSSDPPFSTPQGQ